MYLSVAYVKQIEQAFQQDVEAELDVAQASITSVKIEFGYFLGPNTVPPRKVTVLYDVMLFVMDNRISAGGSLKFTRRFTYRRPVFLLPKRSQYGVRAARRAAGLRGSANEIALRIPALSQVFSADEYAQYVRIRQQAASVLLAAGS